MKLYLSTALLLLFTLVSSCKKEETAVAGHQPGNVMTATVNMNTDYRYQVFYDLETNSVVSKNLKTDWDMGFETDAEGYRIILNSAKAMFAWNTGESDFENVLDTTGFAAAKQFDAPDGNLDSTAIGNWKNSSSVYIIDRGYTETGQKIGFRKMMFLSVNNWYYTLRLANMDGTGDTTFKLFKDPLYNFTFVSLNGGVKTATVEPPKDKWDLVFTQYLEALGAPYLVTGVQLNRHRTQAQMDSTATFSELFYEYAASQSLSNKINTIGYNWKKYDYDSGSYTVSPKMNYIIKDSEGYFYKFHFINFYDSQGNKGNPKWEYQKL